MELKFKLWFESKCALLPWQPLMHTRLLSRRPGCFQAAGHTLFRASGKPYAGRADVHRCHQSPIGGNPQRISPWLGFFFFPLGSPHLQGPEIYSRLCYRWGIDMTHSLISRGGRPNWNDGPSRRLPVFTPRGSPPPLALDRLKTEWASASVVGGQRSSVMNQNTRY